MGPLPAEAKAAGTSEVTMTKLFAYRRGLAHAYVADEALDPYPGTGAGYSDVVEEIVRLPGGRGVDVAFQAADVE
jgi:threonine dehydrogenase-like Zn-dependent dehydrogenase